MKLKINAGDKSTTPAKDNAIAEAYGNKFTIPLDFEIIKRLAVKFEGNEILSIDNYGVFACYRDLWKTKSEKRNAVQQGIISTDGDLTFNCMKLRINAGDKSTTRKR